MRKAMKKTSARAAFLVFLGAVFFAGSAHAQICGADAITIRRLYQETRDIIRQETQENKRHIEAEFADMKSWLYDSKKYCADSGLCNVFIDHLLPAWQKMTEDITVAALHQEFI